MTNKKYEKKPVIEPELEPVIEPLPPEPEPEFEPEPVRYITVDTGALNVREDFCMDSVVLTVIHKGETYPILESSSEWYKIQVGDIIGWCRKEFTR